jgi:hypothetical protein
VKYWEIIADNLSKAGSNWGCVSAVDSAGAEPSGLPTRIAAMEDVSFWGQMEKLTAFLELEAAIVGLAVGCGSVKELHPPLERQPCS